MTPYKKQHHLAASYLGTFSSDANSKLRKRKLYRTDMKTANRRVVYENECLKNYFYSTTDREKVEREYGELEGHYTNLVKQLSLAQVSDATYMFLLNHALSIHFRSINYDNFTDSDRQSAQNIAEGHMNHSLVDGIPDESLTLLDHWRRRKERFDFRLFSTPDGSDELYTSDSPSIIFAGTESHEEPAPLIDGGVLPITPRVFFAFGYKTRLVLSACEITGPIISALNALQALCCHSAIYSDSKITTSDYAAFKTLRSKGRILNGQYHAEHIRSNFITTKDMDQLAFFVRQ
ncbi:MAG: DUF4238 domain-containing protein [Rhodospirillaceae bacterium]|nr:DUF4238 domain-containing protein [Rhodospirillaceae bacterium]